MKAQMMHFKLPTSLVNREEFLLSTCSSLRVLHLGCADSTFTDESIASGRWLHAKLTNVAAQCTGVDIDLEMISRLRDQRGVTNIVYGDAEGLDTLGCGLFDVVVAGEIIEHLKNPGNFLRTAKSVLKPNGRLVITTTNAFCLRRLMRVALVSESIHPDHNFYFSHTTLRHLVAACGFDCIEQHNYRIRGVRPLIPYIIEYLATKISANLGEGIIAVCRAEPA
jgi:2-polyprenyl-3-methyl-5-hydroxy-6-metoxy-1,4-benzoquinol methylase